MMGAMITLFATFGGIKAITWTDTQQMLIMIFGIGTGVCVRSGRPRSVFWTS